MRLNKIQLNRISEIFMGIGHVSLGSVIIPALIDSLDIQLLLLGLFAAIGCWIFSVILLRSKK